MIKFILFILWIGVFHSCAVGQSKPQAFSGPWGTLRCIELILEPGDLFVSLSSDLKNWPEGTVWRFEAPNVTGVSKILESSGIPTDLVRQLTSEGFLTKSEATGWYEIRPPEEVVLSLRSEQRAALYAGLFPKNKSNPLFNPYPLPPGGIDSVLGSPAGVPSTQIDRIRRMTYKKGDTYLFSDIGLLLGRAENDRERFRIIKTISRQAALSLHLEITDVESLSSLANYWSAGGRNKEILPILESVARTSDIDSLDIVHLLPPFPRKVLNTYPSPYGEGIGDDMPDCFWTAFSFFSESPPDRYFDSIDHVLIQRYERALPPGRLGDLVLLTDAETGRILHACNYIAGEFVFTKNGHSVGRPWIISPLKSVVNTYLERELNLAFYRLKPGYRK